MNTPTHQTGGDQAHATLRQFLDRFVREADGLTGETVLSTYEIQPSPLDMCEAMEALETLRTETATLRAQIDRMTEALEMAQERIAELSKWAGIPNEGQTNDEITAALQSVAKEGEGQPEDAKEGRK